MKENQCILAPLHTVHDSDFSRHSYLLILLLLLSSSLFSVFVLFKDKETGAGAFFF